jgi:hypothetical protein
MKTYLLRFWLPAVICLTTVTAMAQTELAPDQNPNYAVSRNKYMQLADSVTRWHSTTSQDTYKAIDWLADRKEARMDRRDYRRKLRMENVRWDNDYYDNYNYYPSYRNRWGNYRNSYNNGYYRRGNSFYVNPWGLGYWWR